MQASQVKIKRKRTSSPQLSSASGGKNAAETTSVKRSGSESAANSIKHLTVAFVLPFSSSGCNHKRCCTLRFLVPPTNSQTTQPDLANAESINLLLPDERSLAEHLPALGFQTIRYVLASFTLARSFTDPETHADLLAAARVLLPVLQEPRFSFHAAWQMTNHRKTAEEWARSARFDVLNLEAVVSMFRYGGEDLYGKRMIAEKVDDLRTPAREPWKTVVFGFASEREIHEAEQDGMTVL